MWSMPRNPQRKPKPRASEVSGSKVKLASLSDELLEGRAEVLELVVRGREEAAEDDLHRAPGSPAGPRWPAARALGDRVADPDVGEPLDVGDDVADLADPQLVAGDLAGPEPAQADDLVLGLAGHQADLLADLERRRRRPGRR